MKPKLLAILLLMSILLQSSAASDLSLLTSSPFEMELYPSRMSLQSSAANKLQLSIRTSLFQSTAVTSGFDNVVDIQIILQKIDWNQEEASASVQFQVHVTFYSDTMNASKTLQPSRFSLDSLIARTFSQPSTKSGFIVQLGLSQDPTLSSIQEVSTELVSPIDDKDDPSSTKENKQFSTLDIVLVTASATIFLGILGVVYMQHRARERYDEDFLDSDTRKVPSSGSKAPDVEEGCAERYATMVPSPNVDVTASMDSDGQLSHEQPFPDAVQRNMPGIDDDATVKKKNEGLSSNRSTDEDDYEDSPPVSPSPSVPSSSSEVSATTPSSSSVLSSPVYTSRTTAYLLGVASPTDKFDSPSALSPLAARLLRLPSMSSAERFLHKGATRSYFSAPATLVEKNSSSSTTPSVASRDGARSVRSVRSLRSVRSGWSSPSLFDVTEHPGLETASTRSSTMTDLAVISDCNLLPAASGDFEKNWKVSEKLAEDDEDGSTMDVFHVEVDQNNSIDDNQSRMSGRSAISNWMKSIRVVGGSVDSRTSEMSKSSAEHSSVEPRFLQVKDNTSVDPSLERSLATSVVEV